MSKKENLELHAYEFSTVLVNSLCFDLSFAKGGFINQAKSVSENAQAIFLALGCIKTRWRCPFAEFWAVLYLYLCTFEILNSRVAKQLEGNQSKIFIC